LIKIGSVLLITSSSSYEDKKRERRNSQRHVRVFLLSLETDERPLVNQRDRKRERERERERGREGSSLETNSELKK